MFEDLYSLLKLILFIVVAVFFIYGYVRHTSLKKEVQSLRKDSNLRKLEENEKIHRKNIIDSDLSELIDRNNKRYGPNDSSDSN